MYMYNSADHSEYRHEKTDVAIVFSVVSLAYEPEGSPNDPQHSKKQVRNRECKYGVDLVLVKNKNWLLTICVHSG